MKRDYRFNKILGLVIIVLIILVVFYFISNSSQKKVIKIGAVLPLTGEGTSDQGQASQKAITLAVEEINEAGGLNDKKIDVIFEDSQCEAQKGVSAIRKLIDIDKVDFIIGDICDSVTEAIIPIAESRKKVLITPGSTSPTISDGGDYIFRFWFSENDLGKIVAEQAYKMGYRDISVLYINNAWGTAQNNGVSNGFKELGGRVVLQQAINPDNVDYQTILLKSEEKNPDAYYIGLHPNGLVTSIMRMKERGINKQIFSHGGLVGSTQVLGLGGDLLEGIIAPFVYDPSNKFREDFIKRYNSEPGITADSSYDAVMVVAKIIKESGDSDSDTIKKGLYQIKSYQGVSGDITIDSNGDVHRPLRLMIVKDNKLVPYS